MSIRGIINSLKLCFLCLGHKNPRAKPNSELETRRTNAAAASDSENPLLLSLPDEIIYEILSMLPVKSLLRFQCVSKSWLSIISSPHFIKSHLNFAASSTDNQRILLMFIGLDNHPVNCSVNRLLYKQPIDAIPTNFPTLALRGEFAVMGCCDGMMVCSSLIKRCYFLWNPSTRKCKELPNLGIESDELENKCNVFLGLGYDETNDDYKVVGIVCLFGRNLKPCSVKIKVYTTRSESWRTIEEDFPGDYILQESSSSKFLNGKLHWVVKKDQHHKSIFTVDLETERYVEFQGPDCIHYTMAILEILKGRLCLLCNYDCRHPTQMWIMMEYGVKESWTKVLTIPRLSYSRWRVYKLFGASENGEVLLDAGGSLVLYNAKDRSFKNYQTGGFDGIVYVESLVSPYANDAPEKELQQEDQSKKPGWDR
ncbi:hypothetical protein ACH5RR_032040 [Cinchona calisaya]|uniref:F-box domain-containing protein n=1 Tax=Cinchona calisaya TaxID=153742 RepID=A0ABD2YM88_9GENT